MKKLLIAVALVACATFVNAASVNWGGAITAPNGVDPLKEGQTAALLWSSTAFTGGPTKISGFSVGATADNGGKIVDTYALNATDVDINNAVFMATYDNVGAGVDGYYAILIAADDGKAASYMDMGQITGTGPTSQPSSLQFNADWDSDDQLTMGGYTAEIAGVPEPSSGFLLILGMAGLALRRRRA